MPLRRKKFSELVLQCNHAAENPAHWLEFLRILAEETGADVTTGLRHDLRTGRIEGVQWGLSPEAFDLYVNKYAPLNPWLPEEGKEVFRGNIVRGESFLSLAEMRRTQFYAEWGRKNNVVFTAIARLDFARGKLAYVSIGRGEKKGPFSETATALLEALFPHLQQSARISQMVLNTEAKSRMFDSQAPAAFFLSSSGRVVEKTGKADDLLARTKLIQLDAGNRLSISDAAAGRRFQRMFQEAVEAEGNAPFSVSLDEVRPASLILVGRRISNAGSLFGPAPARFAVLAIEPHSPDSLKKVEAFGSLFRLTNAQSRMVHALIQYNSLKLACGSLNINRETGKTHLAKIFRKTGTDSQISLVRLAHKCVTHLGDSE